MVLVQAKYRCSGGSCLLSSNKGGLHFILRLELHLTAVKGAGGGETASWCGPRCHSCRVSLTWGDWNVIARVSFPERFEGKMAPGLRSLAVG